MIPHTKLNDSLSCSNGANQLDSSILKEVAGILTYIHRHERSGPKDPTRLFPSDNLQLPKLAYLGLAIAEQAAP